MDGISAAMKPSHPFIPRNTMTDAETPRFFCIATI
jgi:hypothetical protein